MDAVINDIENPIIMGPLNGPICEHDYKKAGRVIENIETGKLRLEKATLNLLNLLITNRGNNYKRLIFLGRQGIPIYYLLKGAYFAADMDMPSCGFIVTGNTGTNKLEPSWDCTDEQAIVRELGNEVGKKAFIDTIIQHRGTQTRMNKLATKLDPLNQYDFLTLNHLIWDIDDGSYFSRYLSCEEQNLLHGTDYNVTLPESNYSYDRNLLADTLATSLFEIGYNAGLRF